MVARQKRQIFVAQSCETIVYLSNTQATRKHERRSATAAVSSLVSNNLAIGLLTIFKHPGVYFLIERKRVIHHETV